MDMSFHHHQTSGLNQQAISFRTSPKADQSDMIMMGDSNGMNRISGMSFSGNNSCDSVVVVDSVPESKHRAGLAAEWSVDEQYQLEEALKKFGDESGMLRYVKIAATLRNKTVRDVAIRCRWMARKRRKHEELNLWKKPKDKKDKLVEASSKLNGPSISTINVAPLSVPLNHLFRGDSAHFEALQGSVRHLLDQNNQVLGQISTNLSALKLQDNVDLFGQMKNNVSTILNDMRCLPGPPLPISLNEDLANTIISIKTQTKMFASPSRMNMKQEKGCW